MDYNAGITSGRIETVPEVRKKDRVWEQRKIPGQCKRAHAGHMADLPL